MTRDEIIKIADYYELRKGLAVIATSHDIEELRRFRAPDERIHAIFEDDSRVSKEVQK